MDAGLYNGLVLAYIGDAIYEVRVRKHVMEMGLTQVNGLHKAAIKYTSGEAQARVIRYFKENNLLTDEELSYYKRGRNSSVSKVRKHISRSDYLDGTGFESLIGYLYLENNIERLNDIMDYAIEFIDKGVDLDGENKEK